MGIQVAGAWALLGFAAQCCLGWLSGWGVDETLRLSIGHFFCWGFAGFLVGMIGERFIESSCAKIFVPPVDREPEPLESPAATESEPSPME